MKRLAFGDGDRTGVHSHDEHQLSYADSGVLGVAVDDANWVVPPLRAVWIPAGVEHELTAYGPTTICPLYIDSTIQPKDLDGVAVVSVNPLLRALIQEFLGAEPPPDDERQLLESLFVLQLGRLAVRPLHLQTLHEPRLAAIQEALTANPGDRRTLSQWGRYCGASERTLTRLFSSEARTTFTHWRTQLRIQHSLLLLADGTSVTTTAHRCGYESTSAFIETFRLVLGTTPGKFFNADPV